jgi:hypothetical protein
MCENRRPTIAFAEYRAAVQEWLASAPEPDVALVAAADLLDGCADLCEGEAQRIVLDASDVHATLGAGVLLALRHICDD